MKYGRILVVDDEPELKEVLSSLLRFAGHEVDEAKNAPEAMALVKSKNFDLIVSDVRMSGGGGLELVSELRRFTADPKIILISGFTGFDEKEAMQLGVLEIFYKPFNFPSFLSYVEKFFLSLSR